MATFISSLTIHAERTRTDMSWVSCLFWFLWEFASLFELVSYQSGTKTNSFIFSYFCNFYILNFITIIFIHLQAHSRVN